MDYSKENGVSDPELDYVYGKACNVNGFVNEEGSVDSLLSSLDLFKFFSSNCRAPLVFYAVIYVQPSQKIHITKVQTLRVKKIKTMIKFENQLSTHNLSISHGTRVHKHTCRKRS